MKGKQKILSILLTATLLLTLMGIGVSAEGSSKPDPLQFNDDGSFKIIQVSDLQEILTTSAITKDFLWAVARQEKPDLFILTGDNFKDAFIPNIKGLNERLVRTSIDSFMSVFQAIYDEMGIPVTMVLGNHDAENSGISRQQQFEIYAEYSCFIGEAMPEADEGAKSANYPHYGTHYLQIKDSAGAAPVFNLWMFDSGDYAPEGAAESGYDNVQKPQVDWFNDKNTETGIAGLPSLAFQHIIVQEIYDYLDKSSGKWKLPSQYKGVIEEDPCPGYNNAGQLAALDAAGCMAVFSGHDHMNTFEIPRGDGKCEIINTPTAGFGSYGKTATRGVRIITLNESNLNNFDTKLLTYKEMCKGLEAARFYLYVCCPFVPMLATALDYMIFYPIKWLVGLFTK